jgi:hypothetical protein
MKILSFSNFLREQRFEMFLKRKAFTFLNGSFSNANGPFGELKMTKLFLP